MQSIIIWSEYRLTFLGDLPTGQAERQGPWASCFALNVRFIMPLQSDIKVLL